ncbi:ADP-ribosylglycohydrolase family protein [Methylobacterium oxalidis]|uniref:ADP-ribosylglycohydrolase family protein n=1 Tax=Methylobacterium oxalidis TaxID=944322 RepID=UPI00331566A7
MNKEALPSALRIAEIPVGLSGGCIGITFAPGKKQISALSGSHDRDLGTDLDVIAAWNAAVVVTLVEAFELKALQIAQLGEEVRRRFMEWHHLPIQDVSVPDAAFEALWPEHSARLRNLLESGGRVLIHCKGGLGRAGMISARLLVELGAAPPDAISAVRAVRPGAIETEAQAQWVQQGLTIKPAAPTLDLIATRERAVGALVGLAAGDAVGTTLEFQDKPPHAILQDMVGGGPFGLKRGEWTDDTAMALALAESLLADSALDPHDLMTRFVGWYENGTYSCTGECFDIGTATRSALDRFRRTGEPLAGSTGSEQSGNGALMRISPVAIRHWRNRKTLQHVAGLQTRTTHGSPETIKASSIMADLLADLIAGKPLPKVLTSPAAEAVEGGWRGLHRDAIRGSGYVAHSLQAAIWALSRTTSFRSAVLLAANLGEDADTTAAITGQLAGAAYGLSGIPQGWLEPLAWRKRIETTAVQLFDQGSAESPHAEANDVA